MFYYNIAFDFENKKEYFYYYTMEIFNNGFYHPSQNVVEQKLGGFLLEFLNTNFRKRKNFDNFVIKYCFVDLYSKLLRRRLYATDVAHLKLSEEDFKETLNKIYKKYSKDFIEFSEVFRDIANTKTIYKTLSNHLKIDNPKDAEFVDIKSYNLTTKDYWKQLAEYSELFDSVYIDFDMLDFYDLNYNKMFSDNIPYSFRSRDALNIIYLSFKHIECYKHPILQCQNCKKLFIPDSAHDIKYCNEIFKNNKTCKQLAPDIAYQKILKEDPLLKKYRSRYQSLQKQSSENPGKYGELYENYKKEGKKVRQNYINGIISAKEFENWINCMKIRK